MDDKIIEKIKGKSYSFGGGVKISSASLIDKVSSL
jgi:hypothetical protein